MPHSLLRILFAATLREKVGGDNRTNTAEDWDPLQMGLGLGRLALWLLVGALVLYPLGMVFVSTVFAGSLGNPLSKLGIS
ncbi:MAG: hypothetical protein Q6K80_08340 [Thermostichus sp. DG_1_6_bins_120]